MKITCKHCGIVNKPHKCPHTKMKRNRNREDNKIYESKEYRALRKEVLDDYNYMCLWSLYVKGKVKKANETHHIIELLNDDSKAIEYDNLIPLTSINHDEVHWIYKNTIYKEEVQRLLTMMCNDFKAGDKTLGKYKKAINKYISPPMF